MEGKKLNLEATAWNLNFCTHSKSERSQENNARLFFQLSFSLYIVVPFVESYFPRGLRAALYINQTRAHGLSNIKLQHDVFSHEKDKNVFWKKRKRIRNPRSTYVCSDWLTKVKVRTKAIVRNERNA